MNTMKSKYHAILRRFIRKTFRLWERLGFHITECHFYQPVPVVRNLDDAIWERESEMLGISMNEEKQIAFLENICAKYKFEYDKFGLNKGEGDCRYYVNNGSFGEIDGDILYCMVRHFKPKRIIEVGCGWSTLLIDYALKKNSPEPDDSISHTAIDPFLSSLLKNSSLEIILIEKKIQDVDLEIFTELDENDILFLDTTHIVNIGSDVCYEFFNILPMLKKGVLVHIHDIFLPYEYPKEWIQDKLWFWNEAYLLRAFLMYNDFFEIIWAGNWMENKHPEICREMFRSEGGQSFWIKKIK